MSSAKTFFAARWKVVRLFYLKKLYICRMKIAFDIFAAEPTMAMTDEFMHVAGLFEPWKRLVDYAKIEINVQGDDVPKMCQLIALAFEQKGGYAVFVGTKSPGIPAYVLQGVKALSMAKSGWCPFADALRTIGYEVELDDEKNVLNAKPLPAA